MSHIVSIQTQIKDAAAVEAACRRLGLNDPLIGSARLYAGEVQGLMFQLPGWTYPCVIDTVSGQVNFDNYQGHWGEQKEMDRFLQAYAVEKTKLEARKKGYLAAEQELQDGSIQVRLTLA